MGRTTTADGAILTWRTLPFLVGGFLGPFGTMVVISIYPELRNAFDASTAAVTWSFSGYLFAMAVCLLVSGTIGERYGRRRVTRITFWVYALASIVAAFTPTLGLFIAARIVMGAANAFITPLLIAGLSEIVEERRLGRAVGVYAGFQAAGSAVAPFASGLMAEIDWRWTFVLVAAVSILLSLRPAPGEPRQSLNAPPIRPLFRPAMTRLWLGAFTAAAGPLGLAVLVGVRLRDELDVSSSGTGAILLTSGLLTMATSPRWGSAIDRLGGRRASLLSLGATAAIGATLGIFGEVTTFVVVWLLLSVVVGLIPLNLQRLAAIAVPENRGGALSSVLAFRFFGHAAGPLVFIPMLEWSSSVALAVASGLGLITLTVYMAAERPEHHSSTG